MTTPRENIINLINGVGLWAFGGMTIVESPYAIKRELRFPHSLNRSRRIHKKLTKRLGEQEWYKPTAYMLGDKLIVHPEVFNQIRELR